MKEYQIIERLRREAIENNEKLSEAIADARKAIKQEDINLWRFRIVLNLFVVAIVVLTIVGSAYHFRRYWL